MIDLAHAKKAVLKTIKCLANAQAVEGKLCAAFCTLQSNNMAALVQKADLDIGITTLAAMK